MTMMPGHIAVIMDGNGRWAKLHGLARAKGHDNGAGSVNEIVTECARLGIRELTLYALSTENFTMRPKREISHLMKLLTRYLAKERESLLRNNIVFRPIGRISELPEKVRSELDGLVEISRNNTGMVLHIALNYGGRQEILDAFAAAAKAGEKNIDEESLRKYFYDPRMTDPDLLIRTGGEMRVSNFLLWQVSYTEFYSTKVLWPDFGKKQLMSAIKAYGGRKRKYGGLFSKVKSRR